MEVRLSGRMNQCPIRLVALGLLDHCRQREMPGRVTRQNRQTVECQCGLQRKTLEVRPNINWRCVDFGGNTHPTSVVDESIGRQLCRRREFELVIIVDDRDEYECLEDSV